MDDEILDSRLPIEQQIALVNTIQNRFLDFQAKWGHLPDDDGHAGIIARGLDSVIDTLMTAKLREDIMW